MIIILEGMSTSGKTTVQKELALLLDHTGINFQIIEQNFGLPKETYDDPNSNNSLQFLLKFLQNHCEHDKIIICDRLNLSHAAITDYSDEQFKLIDKELNNYDPLLVFLKINETEIPQRLREAVDHRGQQWVDELEKRGGTFEERAKWFMDTQRKVEGLFNQSGLPKIMFNTTDKDFKRIAEEIFLKYIQPKTIKG